MPPVRMSRDQAACLLLPAIRSSSRGDRCYTKRDRDFASDNVAEDQVASKEEGE